MPDRYLFRGKRIQNNEYVVGSLMWGKYPCIYRRDPDDGEIYSPIDPSTVGQCTGLRDKNGTLIWEGDILRDEVGSGEVEWLQEYCQFVCRTIKPHKYHALDSDGKLMKTVVIGTIHTTPELMEGNNEQAD